MATVLETPARKALKGVISNIEPIDGTMVLISAEIDEDQTSIATELPQEEVKILNLRVGDMVDVLPISFDTYLIVGKPKQ
jgi:hypothetical protein